MSAHLLQDDVIRPYHPHALGRSNAVLECIHVGIYIRDRVLLFVIFDEVVNLCDICGLLLSSFVGVVSCIFLMTTSLLGSVYPLLVEVVT